MAMGRTGPEDQSQRRPTTGRKPTVTCQRQYHEPCDTNEQTDESRRFQLFILEQVGSPRCSGEWGQPG